MLQKKTIPSSQLEINVKYFIEYTCIQYTGEYNIKEYIGIYKGSYKGIDSSNFYILNRLYVFYNDYRMNYYEVDYQKEKIQDAMELRAVNQILQLITGDNLFTY